MKTFSLLTALVLSAAVSVGQAQTVINGVTIIKPGQTTPAPARRTVPAFVDSDVPADWTDIRGRISVGTGARMSLPAGSRVTVSLVDVSLAGAPAKTLVSTTFPSSTLPVSYQLVSSPRRFTTSGSYAVQVSIKDASGKPIYANAAQYRINPAAKRILADIKVAALK
ncbi:hypothetical protein DKM44_02700 [Deinococcus irradiatisoli]|uniref:Uncharacterized protein n=1 Tax=Deinococcus irradiatisoli TaxID=2202254 RepID=A0A2Z3JH50_9DEIO|nr:YbaY family lipoprotein [Deinococcus irradiatisoli]AWN22279.1 hypothetical protein DKM44_02700 [Deinococcus irradiatisoli]